MEDSIEITEIYICKVCLGEIKKDEYCFIDGETYCEDCVDKDDKLIKRLRECEKDMLRQLLDLCGDEESKTQLIDTFNDYFNCSELEVLKKKGTIEVINETVEVK